jgi:hypothetical protein
MRSECIWRTCGAIVWSVATSRLLTVILILTSKAVSPTEKAYRPSHRASVHSAILHDASYFSCIEIKGLEKILVAMLESFCDPQGAGPGSKRCASYFSIRKARRPN